MRDFLQLVRRFRKDEGGAFIAIFGVLAIVLIATAGAVVDYTSVEQARTRAQVALDAAALALQSSIYSKEEPWLKDQAQALLTDRVADSRITATVDQVTKNEEIGEIYLTASVQVPMSFVQLIGIETMTARIDSRATRGSKNIEVALALDITYSMLGSKINDLKTATKDLIDLVVKADQEPTYSKMALVPYSNAVNLGSYAALARGPVQDYTAITGAGWLTQGSSGALTISAISKQNPGRVTTTSNHGLVSGDVVELSGISGGGFTALNGRTFTITRISNTVFSLNGTSTSSYSGTYTSNSGRVTTGTTRVADSISKQNPGRVTTTMPHGLVTGDGVYITGASGGSFTGLNNRRYTVTRISDTVFSLQRVDAEGGTNFSTSSYSGTYTAKSAIIRKCLTGECEVVVGSTGHGLSNGENVLITNVNGMTQINNNIFEVSQATTNTFVLENSDGPSTSTYTSGGRAYCVTWARNCAYYWYENNDRNMTLSAISTCVTERLGSEAYTETPPSDGGSPPVLNWVGNNYPNPDPTSLGLCPGEEIVPLSDDAATLKTTVDTYTVEGSTAGQIGLAWAWYAISPNFAYMWPEGRKGASFDDVEDLIKVVILMTDGAFNTAYCNGVISQNYGLSSLIWFAPDNRINCDATLGDPFDQAEDLCDSIKKGSDGVLNTGDDIILYTVAFDLGSDTDAISLMANCATSPSHAYTPANGDDLADDFQSIGENIAALRIAP